MYKKKFSCNWANDCKLSLNIYIYEVHIYLHINYSQYCNYIRKVDVHVTWPLLCIPNAKIIHIQILGNRTYFQNYLQRIFMLLTWIQTFQRLNSQFYSLPFYSLINWNKLCIILYCFNTCTQLQIIHINYQVNINPHK